MAHASDAGLSPARATTLVGLRMLVGWHFLYEGYYKAVLPAWGGNGQPLPFWSAAAYLENAVGRVSREFRWLAASPAAPWIDLLVVIALIGVGLSLLLGILTQIGCAVALALLTPFYLAQVPRSGVPQPGSGGTYLRVNKTLVEWAAVPVLLVFRTGRLAGLDRLWSRPMAV